VAFNPAGNVVAYVVQGNSPWVYAYPWSSGFGTKYTAPATPPTGNGQGVTFDVLGANIAVAHTTTPFISAYPWSSGFGTKYADPSTLPTGNGNGVTFSPN
jgi:hypothetical protein